MTWACFWAYAWHAFQWALVFVVGACAGMVFEKIR